MTLKWDADYAAVVGNKKREFLLECSKEYKIDCVDVKAGSIIVTMESPSDGDRGVGQLNMQEAVKRIEAEGFLPRTDFAIPKEKFDGIINEGGTRVVRLSANRVSCCRPTAVSVKEIGVARVSGLW